MGKQSPPRVRSDEEAQRKKPTFVHTCSTTSKKTRCSLKVYRWFLPEPKASTLQAFPDDRSNYIHQEGARGSSSRPMLSPSFSHGIEMMLKEQANSRLFTAFVEAFSLVAAIAGQKHRIWSSIGEPYINWEYEWCQKLLLRLLDVRPHFREAFRIASANTAAASANPSSKNLLPRASAVPFLDNFLQYRFREHSASFREACRNRICWFWNYFEVRYEWMIEILNAGIGQYLGWGRYAFRGASVSFRGASANFLWETSPYQHFKQCLCRTCAYPGPFINQTFPKNSYTVQQKKGMHVISLTCNSMQFL